MRKPALPSWPATALLLALLPLTTGCDLLSELLEIPNPAREHAMKDAEGRAIGGACRHAGRSLEDCYALNPSADKASIFAGWRDMNDYMMEHKLEVVPSKLIPGTLPSSSDRPPAEGADAAKPATPQK